MFNPEPDSFEGIPFAVDITDSNYREYWGDEIQVFHNPNAKHALPQGAFPEAVHFVYQDGELMSYDRPGRVLSSITQIFHKPSKV